MVGTILTVVNEGDVMLGGGANWLTSIPKNHVAFWGDVRVAHTG